MENTFVAGPTKLYRPGSIKRVRRTKAEIDVIREAIVEVVRENRPVTVRQVFYQLVTRGVVEKTEAEYKGTVCRLMTDLRREKVIPWGWVTDYTRTVRRPQTYDRLERAVEDTAAHYRRALWTDLDIRVEIWLEKAALAGVLLEETWQYDVPLMVTRGYPSLSFLHGAGEEIQAWKKPTYIYYFGDHDPSGIDIPVKVEAGLRDFAPNSEIIFECVAVTPCQIQQFGLPTRPTKKTDSRSKNFEGDSVEVDAIPPLQLREICRQRIERHLSPEILQAHNVAEESERDFLKQWAQAINGDGE